MGTIQTYFPRRNFLKAGLALTSGFSAISAFSQSSTEISANDSDSLYVIGPREGYSPNIGVLVSMMNYNRSTIIDLTKSLSMKDLDFLFDPKSNSIGALIMHLGAVEKWYQINSFEGRQEFNDDEKKVWGAALELGDDGRKNIKGQEWKYYGDLITEVRAKTLEEFKNKDDKWLLAIDPKFSANEQFNTYWKWFHVCEHESHHRGQIAWLKKRLPGAKESNGE